MKLGFLSVMEGMNLVVFEQQIEDDERLKLFREELRFDAAAHPGYEV